MQLLLSIVFLIIVMFFYYFDSRNYRGITPIFALGVPYGVIMLLVAISDMSWNRFEYNMNIGVPIFSCIYIFIFATIGNAVRSLFFSRLCKKNNSQRIKTLINKSRLKYEKIYFLLIIFFFMFLFIFYIKTFGFKFHDYLLIKNAFATGLPAHISNFTTALMIVFFISLLNSSSIRKIKILYIFPIIWMIFLLVAGTKYKLFIYVFAILFEYTFIKSNKFSLKKISIVSLSISSLFIIVYIVRLLSEGYNIQNIPFNFIFKHFVYYLTGSFYGYSKTIELSLKGTAGIGIVFAPIMNLFKLLSDKSLISTVSEYVPVNIGASYRSTNVFTLFGAIQYETNVLVTIILIIIISFFIHYFFYRMKKYNKIYLIPLNSFLCSTLVVSFFNCFYGTVAIWEMTIILFSITYFERIKINE